LDTLDAKSNEEENQVSTNW